MSVNSIVFTYGLRTASIHHWSENRLLLGLRFFTANFCTKKPAVDEGGFFFFLVILNLEKQLDNEDDESNDQKYMDQSASHIQFVS
jgi:hypothetical protein